MLKLYNNLVSSYFLENHDKKTQVMSDKIQNSFYLLKDTEKVLKKAKIIEENIDFKFLHTLLKKKGFKEQLTLPNLSSKYEVKVYYKKATTPIKWKVFINTIVKPNEEILKNNNSTSESYVIILFNLL
jgi:DNA primase catalytic subunit